MIEVLTKVLVNLYEEPDKPDQAIEFIKTKLGAPTALEFDALVKEKEGLETKVAELEEQLKVGLGRGGTDGRTSYQLTIGWQSISVLYIYLKKKLCERKRETEMKRPSIPFFHIHLLSGMQEAKEEIKMLSSSQDEDGDGLESSRAENEPAEQA